MGYIGVPYKINSGDTLWDIAEAKLGDPNEWPRLYEFNNRTEVVKSGARRIVDPDLIYAGATLRLPIVAELPVAPGNPSANRLPKPNRLRDQLPSIVLPYSTAYEMKGQPIVFDYGAYVVRVRLKGRIILTLGNPPPLTLVSSGSYELSAKARSDAGFTSLMSQSKIAFDPATRQVKFSNKMVVSANNINSPSYGIGIESSSSSGMPVLKAEISYPELKGPIGVDSFVASNVKIEIEIEPRVLAPVPVPVPVPVQAPSAQRLPEPQTDWLGLLKSASVVVVVAVTVVTVAYGVSVIASGGGTLAGSPVYATAITGLLVGGTVTTISVSGASQSTSVY